jgi:hypothetical protein
MLEGIEEEAPTGGYGALFGQRASGAGFRTKEDAAAFLRATDPEGMTTRQQAVGEFMANQALPRLGTITDPARRLAALKEMAASGPPMLNGIVSKIAADGVITDEEMAQAEGMFGGYRKAAESPWRVAGSNIVNLESGEFRSPQVSAAPSYEFTGSAKNIAEAYRAMADQNAPPEIKAAAQAVIAEANRSGQGGGGGRAPSEWEVKRDIRNNPERYSEADRAWASGGGSTETISVNPETGEVTISRGNVGLSTPEKGRIDQQYGQLEQLIPQFADYGNALRSGIPREAAGIIGQIGVSARGLSSQLGGVVPFGDWVSDQMRRRGIIGTQNAQKISEIRARAKLLGRQLLPLFEPGGRYTDKDAAWAEEALSLLNSTGSVESAIVAYDLLRDLLIKKHEVLRQARTGNGYDMRPLGERGGDMPPDIRARPVPQPASPAATSVGGNRNELPADWKQRTPAQRAAWLRGG